MSFFKKLFKKVISLVKKVDVEDISKGLLKLEQVTSGQIELAEVIDEVIKEGVDYSFDEVQEKVFEKTGWLVPEESKSIILMMIYEVTENGKDTKLGSLKKIFVEEAVPLILNTVGNLLKTILPVIIEKILMKI